MKHTGGLLEQMKDAKAFEPLSKEQIQQNIKEWIREADKQQPPERRLLMFPSQYEKYKSNPEGYITDLCNSVWL